MSISSGDSKSASFEDFLRILPDLEMSILIFGFGLFSNVFLSFVYVWIRRLKCYQTVILYSRIYTRFLHTPQCENYGNLLSRIFGKNFVKVTVLLIKKILNSKCLLGVNVKCLLFF